MTSGLNGGECKCNLSPKWPKFRCDLIRLRCVVASSCFVKGAAGVRRWRAMEGLNSDGELIIITLL